MSVLLIYIDIGIITKNAKRIIRLEFIEKSTRRKTWPLAAVVTGVAIALQKSQQPSPAAK
jgi:hypothetical protein